ncbi:Fc.00g098530.m01.CDS01 [Cosmosporella sp. VM-42]
MTSRKRKADEDGDESMSIQSSPAMSARTLLRPSKKVRSSEVTGRPLALPRLLETLDTSQLRTVLERICELHPDIGQEVVSQAPRPSASSALDVLQGYMDLFKERIPYGESTPEYAYQRVRESLVALIDALSDFTPQFLPPNETQPGKSMDFLDGATMLIHELPDWQPQAFRYHKENAYEEMSKAWALVVNEAAKRGNGFTLHSQGWDLKLAQHNERSGGRLNGAINAMANSVGWMGPGSTADSTATSNSNGTPSILDQLLSGSYSKGVRLGPF